MVDSNAKRLERIEARAKKLGWECDPNPIDLYELQMTNGGAQLMIDPENDDDLTAAEALLSLYEPAPVVVIPQHGSVLGMRHCGDGCPFWGSYCNPRKDNRGWLGDGADDDPGPNCPGPAPDGMEWVMMLRDKVNDG